MNKNYATINIAHTIDSILVGGAERLYDHYLNEKLPSHALVQNQEVVYTNVDIYQAKNPTTAQIERVPNKKVDYVPIDSFASKRLVVKKSKYDKYSTMSPKNSKTGKTTNYQTFIRSEKTSPQKSIFSGTNQELSFLPQNTWRESAIISRMERPSTMQIGRQKFAIQQNKKEEKVEKEEKRAATCHVRNRKSLATRRNEKAKFIKLKEQKAALTKEEIQMMKEVRQSRMERGKIEQARETVQRQNQYQSLMKAKKTKEKFDEMRETVQGKALQPPPLTNFESDNGEMFINGKTIQPKTHIIHLQFNPQETKTIKQIESKISGVKGVKKNSFLTSKMRKKIKMTDEEFCNNGSRQLSSIPFLHLNYGIILNQSTLQATASRKRPENEIKRDRFTLDLSENRFKSHIPMINSARLNNFATIDGCEMTARSSFIETHNKEGINKEYETTFESKRENQSILWKVRPKSQSNKIRVSNKELMSKEVLDMKLGLA